MTSLLGKIGISFNSDTSASKAYFSYVEKVSNAASYITPIAWTQSFYSAATDCAVVPATKWIWTKLEKQSSVAEQHPKPSKRCGKAADCLVKPVIFIFRKTKDFLHPESLYKVCKYVKGMTYRDAHSEAIKIPDLEQYNRFGRAVGYTIEGAEKVTIQASRTLYVIADVGEKAFAVRLVVAELAPQLRPSLNEHFVQPIFSDVKKLIAGPQKDPSTITEYLASGARSIGADYVEKEGTLLVDQYLAAKEQQIIRTVTKMEDDARTQAVSWLSNTILREGLNSFVTPIIVSGLISASGHVVQVISITALSQTAGDYVGAVDTAAYVISYLKYLKYANYLMWAVNAGNSVYKLHKAYTPEFTGKVMELLRKSLTRDTAPGTDFDPTKEIREYSVIVTKQCDLPSLVQQMTDKTGLSNSVSLHYLQRHAQNFTQDIKAKSKVALLKYDLIDSSTVEEVSDNELSDDEVFYDCLDHFPSMTDSKSSAEELSDDASEDDVFYDCIDTLPSLPVATEAPKNPAVSDAKAVVALMTDVFNIVRSPTEPPTSSDMPPLEIDPKTADTPKVTPVLTPSWFNRISATVSRVAGAISKFMRSVSPAFLSSLQARITAFLRSFTAK